MMKSENAKILKIMNELVGFYIKSGNPHVEILLDIQKDKGIIELKGCCTVLPDEMLEELNEIINSPRKDEAEEYYWNLIGTSDFSELRLLGALVDEGEVGYVGDKLRIKVVRKH